MEIVGRAFLTEGSGFLGTVFVEANFEKLVVSMAFY